jgi:hypothetical protein
MQDVTNPVSLLSFYKFGPQKKNLETNLGYSLVTVMTELSCQIELEALLNSLRSNIMCK